MRKILIFMMTLVMAISFVACSDEDTSVPSQGNATEADANAELDNMDSETDFVSMNFGNINIKVPSAFNPVEEKEGIYVTSGPNASISVTDAMEVELLPSEWDESLASESLDMLFGATYSNMELAAFEGDVNMNGNTAVYYGFYGTNTNGEDRLVQIVLLYNDDLTEQYLVSFIHSADDEFYTPELSLEIINSITLASEAQNLAN